MLKTAQILQALVNIINRRSHTAIQLTHERQAEKDRVDKHGDYCAFLNFYHDLYIPIDDPEGCWLWSGVESKGGYGKVQWSQVDIDVHRFSYYLWYHQRIPRNDDDPGFQIDHKCNVQKCFNPLHLERVPQNVNYDRRVLAEAIWKKLPPEERLASEIERLMIDATIAKHKAEREENSAMEKLQKVLVTQAKLLGYGKAKAIVEELTTETSAPIAPAALSAGEALAKAKDTQREGVEFEPMYGGLFDKDLKDRGVYTNYPTPEDTKKRKEEMKKRRIIKEMEQNKSENLDDEGNEKDFA